MIGNFRAVLNLPRLLKIARGREAHLPGAGRGAWADVI
jgi:hypothetical protein